MSLIVHKFTIGSFGVNNYLMHPQNSTEALLIDAGEEPEPILQKIESKKLWLKYLVNTHGHGDHIAGNQQVLERTGAELLIHELDAPYLLDPKLNLSIWLGYELRSPEASRLLKAGESIELGSIKFQILHTPGHTPGHITLATDGHAFVGDVIFQGSVGRTDLPLASSDDLVRSIRTRIYTLPEETVLYCGHGPNTTVKKEKFSNPFVSL